LNDLVEGEDDVDVVRLTPQPGGQPRELLAAAGAAEVGLGVLRRESRVHPSEVRASVSDA
jgi:hypothetical protein